MPDCRWAEQIRGIVWPSRKIDATQPMTAKNCARLEQFSRGRVIKPFVLGIRLGLMRRLSTPSAGDRPVVPVRSTLCYHCMFGSRA